ncbi:MAG: hypothetical protein Q4D64_06070 [Prevotellaceae bacterium]|nr:hypothetical protein [Prevotellaceae bacterium]
MKKVISFVTKGHLPDVVRYVKEMKTYFGVFSKIVYTVDHEQAASFEDSSLVNTITKRIMSKYDDAPKIDFLDENNTRIKGIDPFYVIVSEDSGTEQYFVDFDKKGKPFFDKNVRKAYISQSWNDIQNTIDNVRANGGKKVVPVAIAMNIENTLQEPNFVIICKNKHSHKILYLQALYNNGEVRLNPNLKSAEHLGYDEAMEWYEELSMKNKEYHYAVVACPKDNVKSFNLVEYYKTHQNNMRVAVSFRLPDYKKKENGKKK